MTIIVAVSRPDLGYTVMGCDLYAKRGNARVEQCARKWVMLGRRCAIGISGYLRTIQLAEMAGPSLLPGDDVPCDVKHGYAIALANKVRRLMADDGFEAYKDAEHAGGPPNFDCWMILAINGNLYEVDSGFSVGPPMQDGIAATGSGCEYAEGAAFAARMLRPEYDPSDLALMMLSAAAMSPGCGSQTWLGRLDHT